MEELESLSCDELIKKLLLLFETNQDDSIDEVLDWFLFTYNPEHSFSAVAENSESLKDPLLLHTIVTKVKDVYEPEIFLETLNIVASVEGYEESVAATGAVKLVVQMMLKDLKNPRSQQLGCKILGNLAFNGQVRLWIGKMKGITRIIDALRRHQTNHGVVSDSCKALINLSCASRLNKSMMVNEGLVELVLSTMMQIENMPNVSNVLNECLMLLLEDADFEVDKKRILQQAMAYMRLFERHAGIQTNCIWIFVGLISGNPDQKSNIVSVGALDLLFQSMETHLNDGLVQMAACTCLGLLAKSTELRKEIESYNGHLKLFQTIENLKHEPDTQRAAFKALYRLCFSPTMRSTLALDPELYVGHVVAAMKAYKTHPPLQRIAILVLLQCAKDDNLLQVIEREALSSIFLTYQRFHGSTQHHHVFSIALLALQELLGIRRVEDTDARVLELTMENEKLRLEISRLEDLHAVVSIAAAGEPKEDSKKTKPAEKKKTQQAADLKPSGSPRSSEAKPKDKKKKESNGTEEVAEEPPPAPVKKVRKPMKRIPTALPKSRPPVGPVAAEKAKDKDKEVQVATPRPTRQLDKQTREKKKQEETEEDKKGDKKEKKADKKTDKEDRKADKEDKKSEKEDKKAEKEDKKTEKEDKKPSDDGDDKKTRDDNGTPKRVTSKNSLKNEKTTEKPTEAKKTRSEKKGRGIEEARNRRKSSIAIQRMQQDKSSPPEIVMKAELEKLQQEVQTLKEEQEKELSELQKQLKDRDFEREKTAIYIQTLQKERLQQQELYNQDVMNGFFKRNQKKLSKLKQHIETVTDENKKLKAEVEELRALQTKDDTKKKPKK